MPFSRRFGSDKSLGKLIISSQHGLASRPEIRKSFIPAAHGSMAEIVPESGAQRGVFQQYL